MADDVTLFVIFHGSWSFLTTQDMIFVKTPDMGDEHVYRAGSWLAERSIRRGALHRFMQGLTGDKKSSFDPSLNLVAKDSKLASTTVRGSHATLLFAKPLKIHSLGQMTVQPDALTLMNGEIIKQDTTKPMTTTVLQIFEYTYSTNNPPPEIEGFPWVPQPIMDPTTKRDVATLHFFAEHEFPEAKDEPHSHLSDAYRSGCLLLGSDFRLDPTMVSMTRTGQPDLPPLLQSRYFEMEPLASRTERMERLGVMRATLDAKRHPADLNAAWDKPANGFLDFYVTGKFDPTGPPGGSNPTCLPNHGDGNCP